MIDFAGKEVKAVSKYVKTSPNKLRRVLKQLKGKTYFEALLLLKFLPYRACTPVMKTLRSAFANTKDSDSGNEQKWVISKAFIDKGPCTKKLRMRAKGRSYELIKATSHIIITLGNNSF